MVTLNVTGHKHPHSRNAYVQVVGMQIHRIKTDDSNIHFALILTEHAATRNRMLTPEPGREWRHRYSRDVCTVCVLSNRQSLSKVLYLY